LYWLQHSQLHPRDRLGRRWACRPVHQGTDESDDSRVLCKRNGAFIGLQIGYLYPLRGGAS
jgi:hypothetical protein